MMKLTVLKCRAMASLEYSSQAAVQKVYECNQGRTCNMSKKRVWRHNGAGRSQRKQNTRHKAAENVDKTRKRK